MRYASGTMLEAAGGSAARECPVRISSAVYPVRVSWSVQPDSLVAVLRIGEREIPLRFDGDAVIDRPGRPIALTLASRTPLPGSFALRQNYPNPFNPSTTIRFDVPQEGRVRLIVYDLLGREIRTLVNGPVKPGYYEMKFDARDLPSGVYFCRMEAGSFSQVKKMVLVR